jgi:hypothetical protein
MTLTAHEIDSIVTDILPSLLSCFARVQLVDRWWDLLDELTAMFRDGLLLKVS